MVTRKMPQDNAEVYRDLHRLIDDPQTYIAQSREESLRDARAYVDDRVDAKLAAERESRATSLGRRVLSWLIASLSKDATRERPAR